MKINYGQVPKVLLLGNGINRAFDFASWTELIKSIQTTPFDSEEEKNIIENIPYPMRAVVLTEDNVSTQMNGVSETMASLTVSEEERKILIEYMNLPFAAVLTTNYTYELECSLNDKFVCVPKRLCKYRKTIDVETSKFAKRLLHTYFQLDNEKSIWHIHGEAARPDTMVLGHYFYGKHIAKIQEYVSKLQRKYNGLAKWKMPIKCQSWVDYFMMGDVYIVGLGMDLSEMDLWWLINCKKRHFPKTKVILYKPDISKEQELLAKAYGVVIEKDGLKDANYKSYYGTICKDLKHKLTRI